MTRWIATTCLLAATALTTPACGGNVSGPSQADDASEAAPTIVITSPEEASPDGAYTLTAEVTGNGRPVTWVAWGRSGESPKTLTRPFGDISVDVHIVSNPTQLYITARNDLGRQTRETITVQIPGEDAPFDQITVRDGHCEWEGSLMLKSAFDVERFGALGCQHVEGNLGIWFAPGEDLAPLSELRTIDGSFDIRSTNNLKSLHGLEALESISTFFFVRHNAHLPDLQGLDNLREVGRQFTIDLNPMMTTLRGLEALETVEYLSIDEMDGLETTSGLAGLRSLSRVSIENNPSLQTIEGFDGLEQVTNIDILDNPQLVTISGFPALREFTSLTVERNRSLTTIEGFEALETAVQLLIRDNASLRTIEGFGALTDVTSAIELYDNPQLRALPDLRSLTALSGSIYVSRAAEFEDLLGLAALESAHHIYIGGAGRLTDLSGLDRLTPLRRGLSVSDCPALTSLDGLDNLRRVEQDVYIADNPELARISALGSLRHVGTRITLAGAPRIDRCDFDVILDGLEEFTGEVIFRDNGNEVCE